MLRSTNFLRLAILFCFVLVVTSRAQTPQPQTSMTAEQYAEEGSKYAKDKQYDKAVESFKQAIKLNPNLAAAYHGLGGVYINMGRSSDALEVV